MDHIKNIFNFGGHIHLQNCGAKNEFEVLRKSTINMLAAYFDDSEKSGYKKENEDLKKASQIDKKQYEDFF